MRPAGWNAPIHSQRQAPLWIAAILAIAAALARDAHGVLAISAIAALIAQLPLSILYGRSSAILEISLATAVFLAATVIAAVRRSFDPIIVAIPLYCGGQLLFDAAVRFFHRLGAAIDDPAAVFRCIVPAWVMAAIAATILLTLPIATRASIPDYRHNFWLHVSNTAVTATSAACLSGATVYSFGEDHTAFGQFVLWGLTQFSGCALAALGLAIIRPFLYRAVALRDVLRWAFILQAAGTLVLCRYWSQADAPGAARRIWWGCVYSADGIWNTGLTLRANGLANYLLSGGAIYGIVTLLAIIGSLGLPIVFELLLGPRRDGTGDNRGNSAAPVPWKSLPAWDAAGAFWLLLVGALFLTLCETPRVLPDRWVPSRPFEFGSQRIALRDDIGIAARASASIHQSAMLRSAGIQSIPLSAGAVTTPSYYMMLAWMLIGGSVAGTAGGLRVSTVMLLAICLLRSTRRWAIVPDGVALRSRLRVGVACFLLAWIGMNIVAGLVLSLLTDGTAREYAFDTVAAMNNVGLSTGLILHLSWPGRLFMIAMMVAGRFVPALFWIRVSSMLSRATRA